MALGQSRMGACAGLQRRIPTDGPLLSSRAFLHPLSLPLSLLPVCAPHSRASVVDRSSDTTPSRGSLRSMRFSPLPSPHPQVPGLLPSRWPFPHYAWSGQPLRCTNMAQQLRTFEEVGTRREGGSKGGCRQKWFLDVPGRRLILARYDGRSETITELADRLGVPRYVIKKWGRQLGLARQHEPRWSESDISYLETSLHRYSIATIAHHLGRTQTAVKLKAKRLGIRKTGEGYTMRALCQGLGCDHHKVERWIRMGWIKGIRRQSERTVQQGGDLWCFSDAAIRRLIKEHPGEIDQRRVDWLWLIDILTS